jgi:hypothetical protein
MDWGAMIKIYPAAIVGAVLLAASPALAASQITCSQIPKAEAFLHKLKPGPNTRAAWKHLELAKHAKSDHACVTQLGEVNYYAKKSMRADKAVAKKSGGSTQ